MATLIRSLLTTVLNVLTLLSISLVLIYAGACTYAYFFADHMIFPAPPSSYLHDASLLKLPTSQGDSISVKFLPAQSSSALLIYSHGNGEDLGHIEPHLKAFQSRGISVLAYDYPGYGASTGSPSEQGVYAAAEAVYRYAVNDLGVNADRIVLYGRSLGSGPSTWLARREKVAGLILNGAFSSTFRVMTRIKLLPFDRFDNVSNLKKTKVPTLILHGRQDRIVPFSHADQNAKVVGENGTFVWIDEAGHNDLVEVMGERYWSETLHFIRKTTNHEH